MKKLKGMIREALQLPNAEIENRGIIGGMTNLNYLVSIDSRSYIVRVPGNGTEDLINRIEEMQNLKLGSELGINPELRYFNVETGLKITEKIENATTLNPVIAKNEETMKKVATIFRTLHQSPKKMTNRFKIFELLDVYEQLALQAGAEFYDGFEEVKSEVQSLKVYYEQLSIEEAPCHIDPACSNFILDEDEKLYLIDWEYGGMFDPMWDIAAHSLEAGFSKLEEEIFVEHYFQRNIADSEAERMLLHKIFQDYLWSLWTLFKEEKGDDFGTYGQKRFARAIANIKLFKDAFDKSEVY